MTRPTLFALMLAAQIYAPQACRSPAQPAPGPDDTLPLTDQFTTQDGLRPGVQTVVSELEVPWSLAFAPDGRLFFTERPGRVRVYQNGALVPAPALTLDDVEDTASTSRGPINRLARYRELNNTLAGRAVLREGMAAASIHDGGRIRFGPDGKLYLTMGDAADPANSQSLSSLNGKILRLNDDGSSPADNPFTSPIWTWGHRNPQGLDWHPATGDLWATEHGATGNDEINLVPSGASFYTGSRMIGLRGNFFFATLAGRWLEARFGRIRDIVTGPDGALYFCTSNRDGRETPVTADDRIARIIPIQ